MNKRFLFALMCAVCFTQTGLAQQEKIVPSKVNVVGQTDKPSLSEQVFALQKENKDQQQQITDLKTQLTALQTQVNANYKLLDYSLGKLAKAAPLAFTVVAGSNNLADAFKPASNYVPGNYYGSVIIDNAACNGNPNAVVVATSQPSNFFYNRPTGIAVAYDTKISKWKIVINPNGSNPGVLGEAKPVSGSNYIAVAEYYPYQINTGDTFNVIVIK